MPTISSLLLLLILLSRAPHPCEAPTLSVPGIAVTEEQWQATSHRLASQWRNPNDVLTILMIIGGDIVQKALAQLSGVIGPLLLSALVGLATLSMPFSFPLETVR